MIVEQFRTGGDRNFGYLVADEVSGEALVIDASFDPSMIVRFAEEHGFVIRYIFSTHGHDDHTNGNGAIRHLTGIVPLLYGDTCPRTGVRVEDAASFSLGTLDARILYTPGHTPDSICILVGDALFTGDTLFTGKVGGTVTRAQALEEYNSLHEKLLGLPDITKVWPGHDYGTAPHSSIGIERRSNPFLLQPDFNAFLALKHNWAEYKKMHGIA
ncbi:hydroxyacylglutathione hydrolase family protein [Chlorobium ferrooxidans]|uniref:Beta-lactamase-like n=1 Tax=Chlorobium ferrooxidans DSM 13031 TaxID=377431 RepID=Q0YTM1_9CHLB|nr:hydroxyacylglutathione hydrolase family protein [Chlorobium ferrooxidans]EAT59534.1 Beta-lactamase-like [Chlorobium ferrooxidans DSM 13031]